MERIVVGIDGSAGADGALRWAWREAERWDAELEVVLGWSYLDQPSERFDPDYAEPQARARVEEALARAGIDPARVTVRVVNDLPVPVLLAAAEGADLLVVGSRGLGGFRRLLLGSVSQQCALHARCPVVIVHPDADVD